MAIPAGYRSNREPLGTFSVFINETINATWSEVDVRSGAFLTRADVVTQLAAMGLTSTGAADTAVLRQVAIQCVDATNNAQISVAADAGTTSNPIPADAFATTLKGGGVAEMEFTTRVEQTKFQYRAAPNPTTVNLIVRFDVPQ